MLSTAFEGVLVIPRGLFKTKMADNCEDRVCLFFLFFVFSLSCVSVQVSALGGSTHCSILNIRTRAITFKLFFQLPRFTFTISSVKSIFCVDLDRSLDNLAMGYLEVQSARHFFLSFFRLWFCSFPGLSLFFHRYISLENTAEQKKSK